MTRVSAIVAIFEDPSYKEDDQEKGAKIVTLMNEVRLLLLPIIYRSAFEFEC